MTLDLSKCNETPIYRPRPSTFQHNIFDNTLCLDVEPPAVFPVFTSELSLGPALVTTEEVPYEDKRILVLIALGIKKRIDSL